MGQDYRDIVGDVPSPLGLSFKPWLDTLVNYRISENPLTRTTARYISTSGDDLASGSELSPWQSITKAQTFLDAGSGDVALYFKRGDIWTVTTGLSVSKPDVTVGAFGAGDKPLFNRFTTTYGGGDWTAVSGDQWSTPEASIIEWVRDSTSRLVSPLTRALDQTDNLNTPNSFFYDSGGGLLYINLDGADPNSSTLEGAIRNSEYGVVAETGCDGFRIDNIRCDGWGLDSTAVGSNIVGIALRPRDLETALATNCESYFSGSHAMIHIVSGPGNAGGISTFSECTAGYCMWNSSAGETIFNAFSEEGDNEIIFHNCTAAYGTLPSNDWITATRVKRGRSHFGHTSGTPNDPPKLCIVYGGEIPDNQWGCFTFPSWGGTPLATTIDDCRAFIVDFDIPVADDSTTGSWSSNTAVINCSLELKRDHESAGAWSSAIPDYHYWVNCILNADMTDQTVNFGVYNSTSSDNIMMWYHCFLRIRNLTNGTRNFSIDRDNISLTTPTGKSENSQFINSILDVQASGTAYLGVNINAAKVYNNAFRNIANPADVRGQGANPYALTTDLSATYTIDDARAAGLNNRAGTTLGLRYDREWRTRSSSAPWIGPVERDADDQGGFRGRGRGHVLWGAR